MRMNIATFQDDLLELRDFSERMEKFIDTEHAFVEGSLVIALSSKFGSGKSTFLRMWSSALEARESDIKPLVISLNAWESDYNGDPLFAIVSALAEVVQKKGEAAGALLEAARDFGWFSTAIGSQIATKLTGIDPVAAAELAEKKKAARLDSIQVPMDAFSIYEGRKKAMAALKEAIREIVASASPRALFLVDELDRCRPDYAIAYLETIKHLFDTKGAVFVLAADRLQLENSAKTAFGSELDFEEYYRKFVHREVELPPISDNGYAQLAQAYTRYYLERAGSRFCFLKFDERRIGNISELIGALKLTPRQIQEVFRTLGHIFETTEGNRGQLLWCLGVGSIAMAALRIGAPKIFEALGNEKLDPIDAANFLTNARGISYPNWWFTLFLTGGGLQIENGESAEAVMKRAGLIDKDESDSLRSDLSQWSSGWGNGRSNRFKQIHEKIQQLSTWTK
jgi:hypothetical protein